MIVRMQGRLGDVTEDAAILERDGIAFEVLVPSYAVAELAACVGDDITLHTIFYLEGSAAGGNMTPRVIGFLHFEDRAFFRQLITVKGMGVRKALKALSEPAARIASLIEAADTLGLSRLSGIGKRMADQIVAELKGKVSGYAYATDDVPAAAKAALSDDQRAAIEILVAWGDPRNDAQRWIARVSQLHEKLTSAEDWVKAAYRIKSGAEA